MPAGYTELFMEQGASFSAAINLNDANGESFNLQTYSASSQMRKSYYSSNVTASFGVSISANLSGTIIMTMDSANTANIIPGRYLYDVYVKNTSENLRYRVLEGIVNVLPQVTKEPGML